ncbi:MAG: hydrogenase nickel incorporation protein HypB [Deltaproteobacteria bacterium]|nr:hydrogenase nickel incorporation protein HypB [Deltaproteobacteria bacterium]
MCRTCGCGAADHDHHHRPRRIALETDLLARNDRIAEALRARFEHDGIAVLNLIGAPGAGKTALLEHTLRKLPAASIAVIEGDQATDRDARRIAATGRRVVQVNTGAGCHLEASMIERRLGELGLARRSLLFVENVGNLVCPALFDLGERAKVAVVSVAEGEDKPLKYPHVIRAAAALVVTKMDLAPHVDADPALLIENARRVNPDLAVFPVAAARGEGLAEWCAWLEQQLEDVR